MAGIECDSTDPAVARVGFYVFANDEDMLATYLARMQAEGVEVESGSCTEGESEHAYIPDEGFATDRAGCFLNADGLPTTGTRCPATTCTLASSGSRTTW